MFARHGQHGDGLQQAAPGTGRQSATGQRLPGRTRPQAHPAFGQRLLQAGDMGRTGDFSSCTGIGALCVPFRTSPVHGFPCPWEMGRLPGPSARTGARPWRKATQRGLSGTSSASRRPSSRDQAQIATTMLGSRIGRPARVRAARGSRIIPPRRLCRGRGQVACPGWPGEGRQQRQRRRNPRYRPAPRQRLPGQCFGLRQLPAGPGKPARKVGIQAGEYRGSLAKHRVLANALGEQAGCPAGGGADRDDVGIGLWCGSLRHGTRIANRNNL